MVIDQSLYNRQIDNIGSLRHLDIQYNSTSSLKVVGVDVRNFLKKGIAIYFEVGATEYSGYITSNSLSGSDTILNVILNNSSATVVNVPNSTLENVQASRSGGFGRHIGYVRWSPTFTNFSVGNGNADCRFCVDGATLYGFLNISLGSTSSLTGDFRFSNPINGAKVPGETMGEARLIDSGVGDVMGKLIYAEPSFVRYYIVSGSLIRAAAFSSTAPFTWTTNDVISAQFRFKI